MHVVVTGAAGFIGSRLAERLLGEGHAVLGIDRISDYYDPDVKRANLARLASDERFEAVSGDLNDLELAAVLQGVDVVFHLAAQPGVRTSWGEEFDVYLRDNVLATQRLLEGARSARVGRVVFASSSSVYGDAERFPTQEDDRPRPISPYGVTKHAGEQLCGLYLRQYELESVVLRYFTIFGPGQRPDMAFSRFIEAALSGDELEVLGDGEQVRDFTYVDDAVAATIAAAERGTPGAVYNVAGGAQASVNEVVSALRDALGREVRVRRLPPAAGDVRRTGADTSRARAELGYAPATPLVEGLRLQVEARLAVARISANGG